MSGNGEESTNFDRGELKRLKHEFKSAWDCVEPYIRRRKLDTSKTDQIQRYRRDIIARYNSLLGFVANNFTDASESQKAKFDKIVEINLKKLKIAFEILNLRYEFSTNAYAQIDVNTVKCISFDGVEATTSASSTLVVPTIRTSISRPTVSTSKNNQTRRSDQFKDLVEDLEQSLLETVESSEEEENISNTSDQSDKNSNSVHSDDGNNSDDDDPNRDNRLDLNFMANTDIDSDEEYNMVQTKESFLKFAASVISNKYTGEPAKRDSFIADIDLIDEIAEADMKATCIKSIKSRMEGKALEILPEHIPDVKTITDALKSKVKNESSIVIEGKMAALRLEKGNFAKFAEQVEKQAEGYRRSLINEGITREKAEAMSVRKTVELCRKTARSEIVKSVLAATSFETPADVVAKFITETDVARKEKQEADNYRNNKSKNNQTNHNKNNEKKKFNKYPNNNKNGNKKQYNNQPNNKNGGNTSNTNYKGRKNETTIRLVSGNAAGPSASGNNDGQEQTFTFPIGQ